MSDTFNMPKDFGELCEQYAFNDRKEIYTNGSELIQTYRVRQWIEMNNTEKALEKQAASNYTSEWIPVSERLPENAQRKGAFCPKYQVMTRWGQTVGWYNPDRESWYVLLWFLTARFYETEIDIERGDVPEVVKIPLEMGAVIAWQPLTKPYKEE